MASVRSTPRPTDTGGKVAAVLVFGAFMLAGGVMTYFTLLQPLAKFADARHWTAMPCRIISSRVRPYSRTPGPPSGVDIEYAYTVNGRQYRSNGLNLNVFCSRDSREKAAIVRRYPAGSAATCYVNPRDPSEALLERDFKASMWFGLFPLVFFLGGIGGLVWVFKGGGRTPKEAISPADAPWLKREDWAASRIVSSDKKSSIGLWLFGVVLISISVPFLFVLRAEVLRKRNYPILLVLLFPLVGVWLIVCAVRATMRWRKFGESVFEMLSVPGVIGGALDGTVRLSRWLRPEDGFRLRLTCIRRVTSGSGRNSSTTESILWQEEQDIPSSGTDAIPVSFYIPPDQGKTDMTDRNNCVLWRLHVAARVPGVDYASQFEVPVFKVAETAEQVAVGERARAAEQAEMAHYQPPPTSRIRIETSPRGGKEFYFPALRNPAAAFSWTGLLVFWSGALWLQVFLRAPAVFPIVTGLFELLFIFITLGLWFKTTRVVAERDEVVATWNCLGVGRTRRIAATEIAKINTRIGMSAGTTAYYDIKITGRDGTEINAGSTIKDMREAEWLAAEMSRCVGLGGS